eukprot:955589-Pelagomonas_calceolata.AAC.1
MRLSPATRDAFEGGESSFDPLNHLIQITLHPEIISEVQILTPHPGSLALDHWPSMKSDSAYPIPCGLPFLVLVLERKTIHSSTETCVQTDMTSTSDSSSSIFPEPDPFPQGDKVGPPDSA